jgi:hypothetical protein
MENNNASRKHQCGRSTLLETAQDRPRDKLPGSSGPQPSRRDQGCAGTLPAVGIGSKNLNLTREVISLPSALMQQAPSQCRLSNPVDIEVDKNVIKPAWLHMPCWLVFPHYDVTNRVDLTFQFDQPLADLIDEYFMTSGERCRLPSIKVKLIDQSNTQRAELEASDES